MTDYIKVSEQSFWPSLMVFSIFGLDLFSSLPGISAVLAKSITLGLIFVTTFFILLRFPNSSSTIPAKLVYVYLAFLSIRLFIDFVIDGQVFFIYKNTITIFVFFFLTMVIPFYVFTTKRFVIDFDKLIFALQILLVFVLGISVKQILSGHIIASSDGRFEGEGMLDTIYLGHQGLTLFIVSLYKFKRKKFFNIGCAFVGILTILLSGSRGPIIAFSVCLLLFLFIVNNSRKFKIISILMISIVVIFYAPILNALNDIFMSHGIRSFNRITMYLLGEMEGGSGRELIYENALKHINDNPIIGYRYLLDDGSYVHNIFIEQFMALGYLGGFVFVVAILSITIKGYMAVCRSNIPGFKVFYIILIQYIIFGMFSRTVIALTQLWICLSIIVHYSYRKYLEK